MGTALLRTEVVVVGAGPTGLMAGNWLEKLGIHAMVIDAKPGPTRESRALGVHSRTMEIYRQLGVVDEVLRRAVPASELRPGVGVRTLGALPLGRMGHGLTKYPGIHILEQSDNEEILSRRLAARGRAVWWNHAFVSLEQMHDDGRVAVEADGPEGRIRILARYVIGADGTSSPVRRALGIGFQGVTSEQVFYVVDANGVSGTGSGINLRVSEENFMLAFPMGPDGSGGERVRLLGIVRQEDDAAPIGQEAAAVDEGRARATLAGDFGIRYTGAGWFATYRVHHRVADAFRHGRVFLAGDAAHIHSPVGAQGMNTGLQDAHNLVCKLADVLCGRMPRDYLDRYEAERRPVALRLVSTTDRVFTAVTSTSRAARALRTVVLPRVWPVAIRLVPRSPAGGRMFGYVSQIRIHYWMTESERRAAEATRGLARWNRRGMLVGRRLPWVPDNHAPLQDACWQVHAYGPSAAALGGEVGRRHGFPLHGFAAAPGRHLPDGTVVVVRPDGFVAEAHRAAARIPSPEASRRGRAR